MFLPRERGQKGATGASTRRSATATPQEPSGQLRNAAADHPVKNEFSIAKYRVFVGFELSKL
jgi:hypothetical protein